jgi:hypothetical protein
MTLGPSLEVIAPGKKTIASITDFQSPGTFPIAIDKEAELIRVVIVVEVNGINSFFVSFPSNSFEWRK